MVYPRIAALAEMDWTPKALKNFEDFKGRLSTQYQRYDKQGIQFRIPVAISQTVVNPDSSVKVILSDPTKASTIRYTTDGSDVNEQSSVYKQPVVLKKGEVIRYALFFNNKRKSSTDYFPKPVKQAK
jgi:hexosaminidase